MYGYVDIMMYGLPKCTCIHEIESMLYIMLQATKKEMAIIQDFNIVSWGIK